MNIPRRFRDATDPMAAKEWFVPLVERYMADPAARRREGQGVLLAGANGCGKTWTVLALAVELGHRVGRNLDVVYINSAELVNRVYRFGAPEFLADRGQTFDTAVETCTVLVVDDLGHEIRSDGAGNKIAISKLTRLLRKRSDNLRLTFVTTNLPLSDESSKSLSSELGPSVRSLLDELCPFQLDVDDEAPDLRYPDGGL